MRKSHWRHLTSPDVDWRLVKHFHLVSVGETGGLPILDWDARRSYHMRNFANRFGKRIRKIRSRNVRSDSSRRQQAQIRAPTAAVTDRLFFVSSFRFDESANRENGREIYRPSSAKKRSFWCVCFTSVLCNPNDSFQGFPRQVTHGN